MFILWLLFSCCSLVVVVVVVTADRCFCMLFILYMFSRCCYMLFQRLVMFLLLFIFALLLFGLSCVFAFWSMSGCYVVLILVAYSCF